MKQKIADALKRLKVVFVNHPVLEMLLLSIFILLTINQIVLSHKLNSIKYVIENRQLNTDSQYLINSIKINELTKIIKIKEPSVRKKKLLILIKKKKEAMLTNNTTGLSNQIIN